MPMKSLKTELLKKLSRVYGLAGLRPVQQVKTGVLSKNYILQTGKTKYFLKQYRLHVGDKVQEIHAAKDFFSKGGVPVVLPLKSKAGRTFIKHGGEVYALFPYLPFKTVANGDELNMQQLQNLGALLGRMHRLSSKQLPNIAHTNIPEWNAEHVVELKHKFTVTANQILDIIAKKKTKTKFDILAKKTLLLKLRLLNKLPKSFDVKKLGKAHFLHGDFHERNVFFGKDQNVAHVFDLEKYEVRPRALELARSVEIICFRGRYTAKNFRRAQIYVNAYRSVYPITKREVDYALRFLWYRHCCTSWVETEHYLHNDTRPDQFLAHSYNYLNYFSKHNKQFINKIWS